MADPFLGEIILVAFDFAPTGWAECNGQLLSIAEYEPLFNLIGTTFGGDGETTFALPDLRGRVPVQFGTGPGLSTYGFAESFGNETVTLLTTQLPAHTHPVDATAFGATMGCQTSAGNQRSPAGNVPALEAAGVTRPYSSLPPNADMRSGALAVTGTATVVNAGTTQAHANLQPILALKFCISLFGVYPS